MRRLFGALIILVFSVTAAFANSPIPDEDFKEWLDSIKSHISASDKTGLLKQFTGKKIFACKFHISKDGKPDNLRIARSTGDTQLDSSTLELIANSTSLPICPFNQHRMVVLILRNGSIELSQAGYR